MNPPPQEPFFGHERVPPGHTARNIPYPTRRQGLTLAVMPSIESEYYVSYLDPDDPQDEDFSPDEENFVEENSEATDDSDETEG